MKKLFYTLLCLFAFYHLKAQTNDLMIVEYMDSDVSDGLGFKLFNPTEATIDLSNYTISTYHNGNTTPASSDDLTGNLASGNYIIIGNSNYCNQCPSNCNSISINGSNGNDAVVLQRDITIIDMVGPLGTDTEVTIDGMSNGLFENKILRNSDNCIRYTDLAGSGINAWPDNETSNVFNWTSLGLSCIVSDNFSFQSNTISIDSDTTLCNGDELTLDYSDLSFPSYEWVNENNNTATITITDSGQYTLRVETEFLCKAQDDIVVNFISCDSTSPPPPPEPPIVVIDEKDSLYIPNIITPNGDMNNENFVIQGLDSSVVVLEIYNRWGKMVFEEIDYKNDWNASGLADGTYYYVISAEPNNYKGYIEVKR